MTKTFSLFEVIYEDNHLIAVCKKAGVPTQEDESNDPDLMNAVKTYLKEKYKKPGNVFLGLLHRLDRPVSGVVLFAKTSKAAKRLSLQFRERTVKKIYEAWVQGAMREAEEKILVHYLSKDRAKNIVTAFDAPQKNALRSELRYKVIEQKNGNSRLETELLTGRSHQIRVQLSAIGHPIIGDVKYGAHWSFQGGKAIALFAKSLSFSHPITKEEIKVQCHPPKFSTL